MAMRFVVVFPGSYAFFYRDDAMTAMVRDERVRNLAFVGIFKDGLHRLAKGEGNCSQPPRIPCRIVCCSCGNCHKCKRWILAAC
jgi:hypothetical protein